MNYGLIAFVDMEHPPWKTVQNVVGQLLTDGSAPFSDLCASVAQAEQTFDELHVARCLYGLDIPEPRLKFLVQEWCTRRITAILQSTNQRDTSQSPQLSETT